MSVMMRRSKIIITGDTNQIGPICGTGVNMNNMFYAKLFKNNLHLVENHRVCSYDKDGNKIVDDDCKKLLDLTDSILQNLDDECAAYKIIVAESERGDLDMKDKNVHLVYTRKCRNRINNYIYDKFNHRFLLRFRSDKKVVVEMSKGLRLQVNESSKSNEIYKSVVYETISDISKTVCSNNTIRLKNVGSGKIEEIKLEMLRKMVLGFAVTTHSAQGMTIRELCVIHEAVKMIKTDTKILYTAISRMSKRSDLILRTYNFDYADSEFRCKFTINDDESYLDEILSDF